MHFLVPVKYVLKFTSVLKKCVQKLKAYEESVRKLEKCVINTRQ